MSVTKTLSAGWQNKINFIEGVSPQTYRNYTKSLLKFPIMERFSRVSFLGACFGPFYYLWLGMWRKAIVIITIIVIAELIADAIGGKFIETVCRAATAGYCSVSVMFDYFNKVRNGDNSWFPWLVPDFQKPEDTPNS